MSMSRECSPPAAQHSDRAHTMDSTAGVGGTPQAWPGMAAPPGVGLGSGCPTGRAAGGGAGGGGEAHHLRSLSASYRGARLSGASPSAARGCRSSINATAAAAAAQQCSPPVDMEPLVEVLRAALAERDHHQQQQQESTDQSGGGGSSSSTSDASQAVADKVRDATATIRRALKNNKENKARLLAAGGVDVLVPALRAWGGSDAGIAEHAVTSLLNLSFVEGVEPVVTAKGGIEAVVTVLATPWDPTKTKQQQQKQGESGVADGSDGGDGNSAGSFEAARENAAAALFALSGSAANKARVREAGGIAALVELLRRGGSRGKKDAALALFNMTQDEECVREVVKQGAVKLLVGLLTGDTSSLSSSSSSLSSASSSPSSLSSASSSHLSTSSAGPAPDPGMEDKVMAVVASLCNFPEGRQAVHTEGGIAAMVDVMDNGYGSSRAKEDAVTSLFLLATNNEASFQLVLEEGAMPALVQLSHSGTAKARAKAKALLELLRGHCSTHSGSFRSLSYSQTFGKVMGPGTAAATMTGELRSGPGSRK